MGRKRLSPTTTPRVPLEFWDRVVTKAQKEGKKCADYLRDKDVCDMEIQGEENGR